MNFDSWMNAPYEQSPEVLGKCRECRDELQKHQEVFVFEGEYFCSIDCMLRHVDFYMIVLGDE